MTDDGVRLGSMLFTVVEPHEGYEVAYNRWYERDHFYAGCLVGPGILAGRRWVATRALKDLRIVPDGSPIEPDPRRGSYLATYFIEASMSREWGEWGAREVHRLHAAGRMFEHRDHVHTKMYAYRWGAFRDADGVPPELALDHPFAGLAPVFVEAPDGADRKEAMRVLREDVLPAALAGTAVAMALAWTPIPIPSDAPGDVPRVAGDERRVLLLLFLEAHAADAWPDVVGVVKRIEESGVGRVVWASPFIPTIPGTDTYTDELR